MLETIAGKNYLTNPLQEIMKYLNLKFEDCYRLKIIILAILFQNYRNQRHPLLLKIILTTEAVHSKNLYKIYQYKLLIHLRQIN